MATKTSLTPKEELRFIQTSRRKPKHTCCQAERAYPTMGAFPSSRQLDFHMDEQVASRSSYLLPTEQWYWQHLLQSFISL
jgi:hypothetical protein